MKKLIAVMLVLMLLTLWYEVPLAQQSRSRTTIAAASFQNNTGDESMDRMKDQIPEQIATYLASGGGVSIVERSALERALDELKLGRAEFVDPEKAVKIGKHIGATAIIVGSISKWTKNTFSINARLVSTETGLVMTAESVNGSEDEMLALCHDIAASFRKVLVSAAPTKSRSLFKKPLFWGLLVAGAGAGAGVYLATKKEEAVSPPVTDADVSITITLP